MEDQARETPKSETMVEMAVDPLTPELPKISGTPAAPPTMQDQLLIVETAVDPPTPERPKSGIRLTPAAPPTMQDQLLIVETAVDPLTPERPKSGISLTPAAPPTMQDHFGTHALFGTPAAPPTMQDHSGTPALVGTPAAPPTMQDHSGTPALVGTSSAVNPKRQVHFRTPEAQEEQGITDRGYSDETDLDVQMPPQHCIYFWSYFDDRRRIYRVPDQLMRMNKESYTPRMVSFGPYHHGSPQLAVAEKFKLNVVNMFVSQTRKSRKELLDNVLGVIPAIRRYYVFGDNDIALAEIMLRDTFFLIYLMQKAMKDPNPNIITDKFLIENYLGSAALPFLYTDMLLLENQIPLSVVNLFIGLIHHNKEAQEKEDASSFVLRYLRKGLLMDDNNSNSFPAKDGKQQPLHLLDACWRLMTAEEYSNGKQVQVQVDHPDPVFSQISRPFRSVSDLKANSVYFKRIKSQRVTNIDFHSWIFFGKLHLPILMVDAQAKILYSNLIAYEMSPRSTSQLVITSYINFMKSLIVTPKDVHKLREEGILDSTHDNDEHLVKQFKEIDTYGVDNPHIFDAVKTKIDKHCKRKAATWVVELIDAHLRSPWKIIALLAAFYLLFLTTIQTFF